MGDAAPRLIILGSGTTIPSPRRDTSCYLVDDGRGTVLLVDLGPGALHRAARAGYDLERIDAVLLTHVHPDHCIDLATLQFALRNPLPRRERGPVRVFGHPATRLLLQRLRAAWPGWLEVDPDRLEFHDVGPGAVGLPGHTRVQAHAIQHTESSLGYRLSLPGGFELAFSGDAEEGAELLALGREADLFVLEAALPAGDPTPGHLDARRAGRVASACHARHLMLTHFYPPTEDEPLEALVRESFEGRLTLAEDGMVLDLVPDSADGAAGVPSGV